MMYDKLDDSRSAQLSALADGELDSALAAVLVQASRDDKDLLDTWSSYHAIGDALRMHARDVQTGKARQAAPSAAHIAVPARAQPAVVATPALTAANDAVFRWRMVAGVAAIAAVGSMVWSLVASQGAPAGAQLAQRSAPAATAVAALAGTEGAPPNAVPASTSDNAPVMIRDARLDELLAAHKQFGAASALQQPAGFLRNATFQPAGR